MTGSALFDFFIAIVALCGAGLLFAVAIDGIAPNPLFAKIAKIAVGVAVIIALLFAIRGVLFAGGGGGLVVSPLGVLYFAIGIIIVLVVLYLVRMAVSYFAPQFVEPIMYVVGAIALIALLGLAATTLFEGGQMLGASGRRLLR